ncbi:MAG: response regulator [Chromatiales bacterium]|nr:response regulator [Chromatiales bacterium]
MNASPKKRVLVVDDMGSIRSVVKTAICSECPCSVDEAINGDDAVVRLEKGTYDLVICDWDMPKRDGLGVLRHVREVRQDFMLPFIMLTGNAQADRVREAIDLHVTDYIAKPFRPETLLKKVRPFLL